MSWGSQVKTLTRQILPVLCWGDVHFQNFRAAPCWEGSHAERQLVQETQEGPVRSRTTGLGCSDIQS